MLPETSRSSSSGALDEGRDAALPWTTPFSSIGAVPPPEKWVQSSSG